jgi:hypothetical protein
MLTALLAGSGGRIQIPDAVAVVAGDSEDEVKFVDAQGRVLVIFRRADVMAYTEDGALFELEAPPGKDGARP